MGIVERKQRQRLEVRNSILQAAWEVVEQEGWSALSIRRIADAIEYSVPVIYSHFENKDAILLEFTKQGFTLLAEQLQAARDAQQTPSAQLEAIAKAYWEFAFRNREYYQLMFGLGIPACETVNRVAEVKRYSDVILSVIQRAVAESNQPEVDYFLKFHTYCSILHGLVSIQMVGKESELDPVQELVLQDAIRGFIKALG
jgi:AcrR family transcriptional regulator